MAMVQMNQNVVFSFLEKVPQLMKGCPPEK